MRPSLVERRHRFGPHHLAAAGVHARIGDVVVDHAQRRLDHLAAVIDLGDDPVGTVALIGGDGDAGPLDRRVMAGEVGQYIAAAVLVHAGDHRPDTHHKPASKLEAAYHRADKAIQQIVDLLAA
jgi:hypothetical protein